MIRDVPGVIIVQPLDSERVLRNEPTQNDLREKNVLGQSCGNRSPLIADSVVIVALVWCFWFCF